MTTNTRARISWVLLVLSLLFLASVPWLRQRGLDNYNAEILNGSSTYGTLYFALLRGEDAETSAALPITTRWDIDSVSPFGKGIGPTIEGERPDNTLIFCVTGRYLEAGLKVEIHSEGYQPQTIVLKPEIGGIRQGPIPETVVKLEPVK